MCYCCFGSCVSKVNMKKSIKIEVREKVSKMIDTLTF